MSYDWDFSVFIPYLSAFVDGIWITVLLSLYSSLIGTIIGIALGYIYNLKILGKFLLFTNDVVRAVPVLVLMFFFYYFPYVEIFHLKNAPSSFFCASLALIVAQAAFTADIVKSAINTVPLEMVNGVKGVGLKPIQVWWFVSFPYIIKSILPAMIAFYIGNVRLSSLASVIGTRDSVYVAKVAITQNFRSLEAWVIVSCIYIILVLPLTFLARKIENSAWMKRV